jgi:hypothetical protein
VNKTPSKRPDTSPGLQNVVRQLTNHESSVVIGRSENSPDRVKINCKRLFDQISDDPDLKAQIIEREPLNIRKREDVEVIVLVKDKDNLIYVKSPSKHFKKTTLRRGRPARSDGLIDFCSELQSKCLVPFSEVRKVIQTSEEHLLGIRLGIMSLLRSVSVDTSQNLFPVILKSQNGCPNRRAFTSSWMVHHMKIGPLYNITSLDMQKSKGNLRYQPNKLLVDFYKCIRHTQGQPVLK